MEYLLKGGYTRGGVDYTLFIRRSQREVIIIQICVDDIVFSSTSQQLVEQFVEHKSTEFEIGLVGELTYFLGLQVRHTNLGIFISKENYAKNLVNNFGLGSAKHRRTPIGTHEKIARDEAGNGVDQTLYKSMIGSLLYLTANHLDLCYSVGVYAIYQASPKDIHFLVIKKIVKYVSRIADYGLCYTRDTTVSLVGYCDVDWARNSKDRKSSSGGFFFLETTSCLASVENRIASHFPQLRQST